MALGDGIRRNIVTVSTEERNLFVAAIRQLDSGTFVYPNNVGHDGAGVPFQDFESTEGGGHNFIWRNVAATAAKPDGRPDVTSNASILAATNFTNFHNLAKNTHDATAHSYIGGTIVQPHFSFHDPMVFLLHSNLNQSFSASL